MFHGDDVSPNINFQKISEHEFIVSFRTLYCRLWNLDKSEHSLGFFWNSSGVILRFYYIFLLELISPCALHVISLQLKNSN